MMNAKAIFVLNPLAFCGMILLTGCVTGTKAREVETLVTDYGVQFIRDVNDQGSEEAVRNASLILRNSDSSDQKRMAREFLFRDDLILEHLKRHAMMGECEPEVRWLLCFMGSESDLKEFNMPAFGFELVESEISAGDLVSALDVFRQREGLELDDFRTTGLVCNRSMTKAYVQVIIGKGAFNSAGWGLMSHRIADRWVLVWARFEWIS